MKQQNFLFVDIVSSIFLLVILIGNFLGLLYITDGNLVYSLLGSMFLVVCYFFVVQQLKINKELMYKNNFLHPSSLFWAPFFFLGFISFYLMSHFINIEFNCKEKIQKEAAYKIKLVDDLREVYAVRANDDLQNYSIELKGKLEKYKNNNSSTLQNELTSSKFKIDKNVFINPDYINVDQIADAKISKYDITITQNIKNIDSTIRLNKNKNQSIFDNWKRLSLVTAYAKLNDYVEENKNYINSKIEELPLDKSNIELDFDKKQLPLNDPRKLNAIYKPSLEVPIIVVAFTHLFILIPFFTLKIKGYVKSNILDPLEIENVREI